MKAQFIFASLLIATATGYAAPAGLAFYGDPPDDRHPWCVHDRNRPLPPRVEPKPFKPAPPPRGAIVLFDGTAESLGKWESDKDGTPTKWIVRDGAMECVPKSGYIRTKEKLGDCRLHVEWAAPTEIVGEGQGRGNSGIFLCGVEIQVLDSYNNPTYADGGACSMYGVAPPLANALRPPGEFQQIDITFRRPIYQGDKCVDPGYVTVYCNGVLVQNKTQLEGPTGHRGRSKPGPLPESAPLRLQDHGNPVRFRNIWYQPLPPRKPEKGIRGPLSVEETMAMRKTIAAQVRDDAAKMTAGSVEQAWRLAESLVYEKDEPTCRKAEQLLAQYTAGLKKLPDDQITARKDEVMVAFRNFQYLVKFGFVPAEFGPKADVDRIVKARGWDKPAKKK
ncbi:MAG: DUF1080 domain-containing protein [Verrucomicrobia bacterium]|nr:DUF1080 domain-containing protein [Verrucomicrobiota bacterium]